MVDMFDLFDANYGNGIYEAIPDGTGGADILHEGIVVDHVNSEGVFQSQGAVLYTPNIDGGTDVIQDGQVIAHTQPNVEGGMNIYAGDTLSRITIPNAEGGVNIYSGDMSMEGMTFPNSFGSEDYMAVQGNGADIIDYDDPLAHTAEYHMDALVLI